MGFTPVLATDASRPYHHHCTLRTIRLSLTLFLQVSLSFRGIALVLAAFQAIATLLNSPSGTTIRQWLYRVGLFLVQRPLPVVAAGWVVVLDHTLQVGTSKCCLVLGLPVTALRQTGYALAHHDVTVLALEVMAPSTGAKVHQLLQRVRQRVGTIVQVVSDHGSDLLQGIHALQHELPQLVATYDIRHLLAALLKAELQHDPAWAQLLQGCGRLLPQLRQTLGNFLAPPTQRLKARYMNVAPHVQWAQQLLAWWDRGDWAALGRELQQTAAEAKAWFQERFAWLQDVREPLGEYEGLLQVLALAEEQVHSQGLSQQTAAQFWQSWRGEAGASSWRVWQFAQRVYQALATEGGAIPSGQTWLGSSLVIESLFGKYKGMLQGSPQGEMGAEVLVLPVLTAELSNELLREALETVSWAEVQQWQAEQLGESAVFRKHRLLGCQGQEGANDKEGGPKVA